MGEAFIFIFLPCVVVGWITGLVMVRVEEWRKKRRAAMAGKKEAA